MLVMNTSIHEFEITGEFLVIERGQIIKVCKTREEADKQMPKWRVGDYVDVPKFNITSAKISDMGRCGVDYDGDIWYELEDHEHTSFVQEEFRPALVPHND